MLKIKIIKNLVVCCSVLLLAAGARAQTVQDAARLGYYERYDSAEALLHTIILKDPGYADAWYWLISTCLKNDKLKEISDTLKYAPPGVMNQPLLSAAYGHLLLREGDSMVAAGHFDMALKETRMKNPAVLAEVAAAHIDAKSGSAAYAVELLQKAIKRDKRNPEFYILLGDAYRKLMDGGNAYKAYQQALEYSPGYAVAYYKTGKIYATQSNAEMFLPNFMKATQVDSVYAPALYELYYYYYFRDAAKAMEYLQKYIAASDFDPQNDYLLTDMLYTQHHYQAAIDRATALIASGSTQAARLNKLIAYSYKEMGKPEMAVPYMHTYMSTGPDSAYILKDMEAMADIYAAVPGREDSAALYYAKASGLEKDAIKQMAYYKKLGQLYKKVKDHNKEAYWLGRYYAANPAAGNVDLFNWGIASYLGKDFHMADSIFTLYENKYPKEEFGYYWSARSAAAIDSSMQQGLAIPHYMGLLQLAADTAANISKKHLVEAYGYIAAYKANTEKDYESSIDYFGKLLALDPDNEDAKRYVVILKKNLAGEGKGANAER